MTQDHGSNWTPVGSTLNISQTSCNLLVANLSDILSILYNFCPDCVLGAAPAAPSLFGFKSGEPPSVYVQCTETQRKPHVQWRASCV